MTRSAARRPGAVQAEKTVPPPAPPASEKYPDEPSSSAGATAVIPWYWRFVLFLWLTSFVILLLYEWLAGVLKSWAKS